MSFDKENDAPFADISFTSSDGGTCPKKRPRQFSDACDPNVDEEGRCKTRRVDPDRLAERLPLELVAEMDACIFPGAKMPVFGIRKAMQEKYNVDRRNIYDYFHSRGLRVSKEDKHQNLVRSRKAAAAKASASPPSATAKVSRALRVLCGALTFRRHRPRILPSDASLSIGRLFVTILRRLLSQDHA
ncbi:hypothetical protein BD626DRAFT_79106 [Schizophyllum amplum]|uniref:Uncharacterized protein n=1 Tax=Schizophyllum amplum TaxID=97359 RepID=A0A550C9P2_9AGAR|nr:hypothetical protein BD626DRAFT_79106 [Auriculariopsis ampla]